MKLTLALSLILAAGTAAALPNGPANQSERRAWEVTRAYVELCKAVEKDHSLARGLPEMPDEFDYTLGLDVAAHPRLTLAADLLGRLLRDGTRLRAETDRFVFAGQGEPAQTVVLPARIVADRKDRNLLLASLGAKVNLVRNLLVTANVLLPLNDNGLRAKAIPLLGVDYTF